MADTRVLVVDDSAAMRALFCDLLDNAKGVEVCGLAKNADEARDKIEELRPDVVTLDVEMPGMSGMEFLEEIMSTRPMPVIMLSSITQEGTGTAQRALDLGAVYCFPKPLHSSREEFDATVRELGGIVIKAGNGELGQDESGGEGGFEPNGKIVAMACGSAGIETCKQILAAFPANCPPTILILDADPEMAKNAFQALRNSVACEIEEAIDGMPLKPGRAYLAFDQSRHVIIEAGDPPVIRQIDRDPVNGFRPSADLLFGSLARAQLPAVGGLLVGTGADGAKGLQILGGTDAQTCIQKPADYAPADRFKAAQDLGVNSAALAQNEIAAWALEHTAAD